MLYSYPDMQQHTLIPSVYAVMVRDRTKVLLLRRRSDGLYTFPNGPLLENEKLNDATARIISECVFGIKTLVKAIFVAHVMRRHAPGEDKIHFFCETQVWRARASIGDPKTYDEVVWAEIDAPPRECEPFVFDFLRYVYTQPRIFSELGWGKERIPKKITSVTWF